MRRLPRTSSATVVVEPSGSFTRPFWPTKRPASSSSDWSSSSSSPTLSSVSVSSPSSSPSEGSSSPSSSGSSSGACLSEPAGLPALRGFGDVSSGSETSRNRSIRVSAASEGVASGCSVGIVVHPLRYRRAPARFTLVCGNRLGEAFGRPRCQFAVDDDRLEILAHPPHDLDLVGGHPHPPAGPEGDLEHIFDGRRLDAVEGLVEQRLIEQPTRFRNPTRDLALIAALDRHYLKALPILPGLLPDLPPFLKPSG